METALFLAGSFFTSAIFLILSVCRMFVEDGAFHDCRSTWTGCIPGSSSAFFVCSANSDPEAVGIAVMTPGPGCLWERPPPPFFLSPQTPKSPWPQISKTFWFSWHSCTHMLLLLAQRRLCPSKEHDCECDPSSGHARPIYNSA